MEGIGNEPATAVQRATIIATRTLSNLVSNFPASLYKDQMSLIASLQDKIITPADKKARELAVEKAKRLEST